MEEVHQRSHFHQPTWLENVFLINKEAGLNILEAALKIAPLKSQNWVVLEKSLNLYFVRNIFPKFLDNTSLLTKDISQILNGENSKMANLFKVSQYTTLDKHAMNYCGIKKQVLYLLYFSDVVLKCIINSVL